MTLNYLGMVLFFSLLIDGMIPFLLLCVLIQMWKYLWLVSLEERLINLCVSHLQRIPLILFWHTAWKLSPLEKIVKTFHYSENLIFMSLPKGCFHVDSLQSAGLLQPTLVPWERTAGISRCPGLPVKTSEELGVGDRRYKHSRVLC